MKKTQEFWNQNLVLPGEVNTIAPISTADTTTPIIQDVRKLFKSTLGENAIPEISVGIL